MQPLRIYIGWDSREDIAYQVARQSILDTVSVPVEIIPLKQKDLRKRELYWRDRDKLASTEFTFTRFLIPELAEFDGWALFMDCDMILTTDIKQLFDQADDKYAVMCAHHDYTPKEGLKMDGKRQHVYPRKNWSSVVLFNCAHPSNKKLTKELVNSPDIDGAYLHRFSWLEDSEVGEFSHEWNWLVGWYNAPKDGKPKLIHYTEGGPWFDNYIDCEYNLEWFKSFKSYHYADKEADKARRQKFQDRLMSVNSLNFTPEKKELINSVIEYIVDPEGNFYNSSKEKVQQEIEKNMGNKVAAIDSVGGVGYEKKGHAYDTYLTSFILGSGGQISNWDREKKTSNTLVIRGLGGGSQKAIKHCWETNRNFYAIDTGYLGNGKSKHWHRITKNSLQNTGPIIERPDDRLKPLNWKFQKFKPGRKILICPPSLKVMNLWDQPDPETWTKQVIAQLKQYTDRPIEVRLKPNRSERVTTKSIDQALADDVHCLVTYNSIAATEAILAGKPAIALGPNAAQVICNTELSEVEKLNIPNRHEVEAFAKHLSYCQFSVAEMQDGTAWRILQS